MKKSIMTIIAASALLSATAFANSSDTLVHISNNTGDDLSICQVSIGTGSEWIGDHPVKGYPLNNTKSVQFGAKYHDKNFPSGRHLHYTMTFSNGKGLDCHIIVTRTSTTFNQWAEPTYTVIGHGYTCTSDNMGMIQIK